MGKPREFGRKVLLDEVDGGIVSRYEIVEEVGREHPHPPTSLEAHQKHFGGAPELLATDRGLYSAENERLAQEVGIKRVVLPKSGRLSDEREQHEKQRWFKLGFRFRGRGSRDQRARSRLRAGSMP
jgi:IS5 family transposase